MLDDAAVARLRQLATWPEFASERYTALEEIARGGMGTVYRAVDRDLGREVAIKIPNGVSGADVERRLAREARVIARLEHPGIIPVHDTGRLADGRVFYVMKHVRGRTLRQHLEHVPDLAERLRLFERICEPVAFAHAQGIIHRDLKPDNIMVGAFGEVMVMDWGVAKEIDGGGAAGADTAAAADAAAGDDTANGTVVGTRGYMSPEQARGGMAPVDGRADVYSLGAILDLLLSGEAAGANPPEPIMTRRGVPRPLRAICARCLEPQAEARYPSVTAVSQEISRYLAGHAVEAHHETMIERAARVGRTYRVAILLIAGYIIMRAAVALTAGW